ncbi:MAG: hypothetical protein IPJ46_08105 [Anaerolineales bacterium]|nr:hypothetical protein [Anaerolineales bacterium]
MSSITLPAEFTLHRKYTYNHTSAVKWILSHSRPYLWIMVMLVVGAIGNAALAAYVPVLTGDAFNAMIKLPPDTSVSFAAGHHDWHFTDHSRRAAAWAQLRRRTDGAVHGTRHPR